MDQAGDESLSDQLRRERLLDMEARLNRVRHQAFGILALAVLASGPWIGFRFLIPVVATLGAFAIVERRLRSTRRPELWSTIGWSVSPVVIAVCAGMTGATDSPALMWLALPVATAGARFEPRGMRLAIAWVLLLLLIVTVGIDPAGALERPDRVIFPFALIIATAILGGATFQSEREHRREAVIDPLTGLLNRTAFAQRLGETQQQLSSGAETTVGFLLGDVDHFKQINDKHGHLVGDAVLRDVAYVLRSELRSFDLVYRIGGEEFAVLLPGADADTTHAIAERLRAAVAAVDVNGVRVTMSFGAATVGGHGARFPHVYAEADAALYSAKRGGRDRVAFAAA
jgi:diguanylate cyclase (GGDEF)-like protein